MSAIHSYYDPKKTHIKVNGNLVRGYSADKAYSFNEETEEHTLHLQAASPSLVSLPINNLVDLALYVHTGRGDTYTEILFGMVVIKKYVVQELANEVPIIKVVMKGANK